MKDGNDLQEKKTKQWKFVKESKLNGKRIRNGSHVKKRV